MGGKDKPTLRAGIGINGLLYSIKIAPALFDENAFK
jgi:hypothetical protein